ncbi:MULTISPECIES: hypothetical protein [unclassified Mesorhizobium]|uniref:hypothetical protein n=1 Tax=unclassified Mesorhizobium TaxID=325217 RepID=UPI0012EA66C1|nr:MULTISPECIES: hypothetical protein [unclassified Mesorhizobium]
MAVKDRRRHHRGDAFDAGRGAAGFIASGDLPIPARAMAAVFERTAASQQAEGNAPRSA